MLAFLERRLGAFWARAFLIVVLFGVGAWAVESFVVNLILPISEYLIWVLGGAASGYSLAVRLGVAVALALAGLIVLRLVAVWFAQSGEMLRKDAVEMLAEMRQISESAQAALDEEVTVRNAWLRRKRTKLDSSADELLAQAAQMQEVMDRTEARVDLKLKQEDLLLRELRELTDRLHKQLPFHQPVPAPAKEVERSKKYELVRALHSALVLAQAAKRR
jgi:hypothetical protein